MFITISSRPPERQSYKRNRQNIEDLPVRQLVERIEASEFKYARSSSSTGQRHNSQFVPLEGRLNQSTSIYVGAPPTDARIQQDSAKNRKKTHCRLL